jgi:predicted acylesterase/phospholipase RssA
VTEGPQDRPATRPRTARRLRAIADRVRARINPTPRNFKTINLALRGGGAHGAFTWGVLDALLEDERLDFEAISGTSAGAMNAVVLADGLMRNGSEGARDRLGAFWRRVSRESSGTGAAATDRPVDAGLLAHARIFPLRHLRAIRELPVLPLPDEPAQHQPAARSHR